MQWWEGVLKCYCCWIMSASEPYSISLGTNINAFFQKKNFWWSIRIGSLNSWNKSYALLQNILNIFESFNDLHKSWERRTLETFVDFLTELVWLVRERNQILIWKSKNNFRNGWTILLMICTEYAAPASAHLESGHGGSANTPTLPRWKGNTDIWQKYRQSGGEISFSFEGDTSGFNTPPLQRWRRNTNIWQKHKGKYRFEMRKHR